jgi:hypothetical protein
MLWQGSTWEACPIDPAMFVADVVLLEQQHWGMQRWLVWVMESWLSRLWRF